MMMPCIVKNLLYVSRRHQVRLRRQQFQPHQARKRSTDEEEERNRDQVQHRNALVVAGQQPAQQAVTRR